MPSRRAAAVLLPLDWASACRIAFRGGERLDTLREPLCGGGVGASEQFARRGVEHGDVSGDVARAAPGQMHGLV